ncbi:MAG: MurR/RpiR family transcriptional regulator [Erysipelotrichaceae bacterium]|nr:MurR/RpiR family transcriptional regulator [Erysipelotrichaceae bacterium]MBQ4251742.1 MurR/RpiR family transcriptional regulator [Erysipelotrichaceae bacterium]
MVEIEHRLEGLTAAERRVAEFVYQNPQETVRMSVSELADCCSVAKSAVTRCCKSLGFAGYKEMKMSLAVDLSRRSGTFSSTIGPTDSSETITDIVFSAHIKTLQDTLSHLNLAALDAIADAIAEALHIYIYGIGSSGVMARDLQHRLFQVGYPAMCINDPSSMRDSAMNMQPGDLAFAFCDSGRTKVTVDVMAFAREMGATTACLTSYADSPICDNCDYVLVTTCNEFKYPIESVTSRVARIAVIDALTIVLSTKNYERSLQKMTTTIENAGLLRISAKNK